MPEWGDTVPGGSLLSLLMSGLGVLEGLPRMLVSGQVILLSPLLRNAMGMRCTVVQLGGTLMVLIV